MDNFQKLLVRIRRGGNDAIAAAWELSSLNEKYERLRKKEITTNMNEFTNDTGGDEQMIGHKFAQALECVHSSPLLRRPDPILVAAYAIKFLSGEEDYGIPDGFHRKLIYEACVLIELCEDTYKYIAKYIPKVDEQPRS